MPAASSAASHDVSDATVSASSSVGPSIARSSVEVLRRVDAGDLLLRHAPLARSSPLEHREPLLPLRVRARRMQARERRVGQELDADSSSSSRPASRPSPHSSASAAPRPQVGSWSSSGGSGAVASIVATRRYSRSASASAANRPAASASSRLPCCAQHRRSGLLAHAAGAGDLVRGIAAERDEVGHLRRLDAVALTHLGRPDAGERPAAALWLEHRRALADELEHVAVSARDERLAAACLLVRDRRGNEVVRLVAVALRDREAERRDELRGEVELLEQVLVEHAPALVGGQLDVAVRRHRERVPADDDGARATPPPTGARAGCRRR